MELTIRDIIPYLGYKELLILRNIYPNIPRLKYEIMRQGSALRKIQHFLDTSVITDEGYSWDVDTEWHKPSVIKMYMRDYYKHDCCKSYAFFCKWKLEDSYQDFLENEMPEIVELAEKEEITRREFFNLIKKLVNYREVLEYIGY